MSEGTVITLPKGTKVFNQGGDWDLGGTTGRLAADAEIEFDRTMDEDALAAMFVAAGKPELLETLDGRYTQHGVRLEGSGKNLTKHVDLSDGKLDQPEIDRRKRQEAEDERLAGEKKQNDKLNKAAFERDEAKMLKSRETVLREHAQRAGEVAARRASDIAAKAAVADDETIKSDVFRARDKAVEWNNRDSPLFEQNTPEELLNMDASLKIAPDKDELDRERRAVEKIGLENAAVAKSDKDGSDLNEVMKKDGTHKDIIVGGDDPSKKETVKNVDETTDLSLKEAEKVQKEVASDRKDTKPAEKELEEAKELDDKSKREIGKTAEKTAKTDKKAKSNEKLDEAKAKAFDKTDNSTKEPATITKK